MLGDRLGGGGMGIVFAAEQTALGRTVAIKLLRPELRTNGSALRRFRDEAIAGGRLSHPNIVSVFDSGTTEHDIPFLAMQRLAGVPLGRLVAGGALPLARAIAIFEQLLDALAEVHRMRIVHGDVKTDNLLVAPDGDGGDHATLIDFGLVHLADHPFEHPDELSGTPAYMAPEIALGEAPTVQSDIYAAGCVLYELIAGRPPFVGNNAYSILSRQIADSPTFTRERTPAFERVIATALAKSPSARYPTIADFAEALHEASYMPESLEPFSCSAPTLDLPASATVTRVAKPHGAEIRAVRDAIASADVDRIIVAYLDLAHAHVSCHHLDRALVELGEAIDLVTGGEGYTARGPAPLWRLLVSCAAIQTGLGDFVHARDYTLAALAQATYARSAVGRRRAERLLAYIARTTAN